MIRNVVVGRLRATDDADQRAADLALLREGLAGMRALRCAGMVAMDVGVDLGLREGNCAFAITNDWQDAESYHGYDADEEHNRLRREVFGVVGTDIVRVQFEI